MHGHRWLSTLLAVASLPGCGGPDRDPGARPEPLVVFHAAALGPPVQALADSLARATPALQVLAESSPSLQAVRKLTDLGRVPDVLLTADVALFDSLVVPRYATEYIVFGTNALVLAYGPHSTGREALAHDGWRRVLLRPGVRTGRSDPTIDPSGYRTLMAVELAERHYGEPGLAARLRRAMPERYVRQAEADLSALVQAGELDYIWTYRNLARAHGLQYVELPPEVHLGDPTRAAWYAQVAVRLARGPSAERGVDSLTVRGAPILFAATVPADAPHPAAARRFLGLLASADGRAVLAATGFEPLARPDTVRARPVAPRPAGAPAR